LIIDITTGNTVGWVRIEGVVRELYDVCYLPGAHAPTALGFKSDEIARVIAIDEA
jgi:hypothetical protein